MEQIATVTLGWFASAGSAAILYRTLKRPWAAWCLSLIFVAGCCAVVVAVVKPGCYGWLSVVGVLAALVSGAVTSSLEARRTGLDRRLRYGVAKLCLVLAVLLTVFGAMSAKAVPWRSRPERAWHERMYELSEVGEVLRQRGDVREACSFSEVFRSLNEHYRARGGEVAATLVSANPFPGLLSGGHYGRLEFWPSEAPPEEVPLLWDTEAHDGLLNVLWLSGWGSWLPPSGLQKAIERLAEYGPCGDLTGTASAGAVADAPRDMPTR